MSALRSTSILQDRVSNRARRQTTGSFFKGVLGGAFATWIQSATKPRRPTVQENQQSIQESYLKIHQIIEMVDQHIVTRLERYEQQLYDVVRDEVDSMKAELKKTVEELNKKIEEKDSNGEIWKLNNQLDYFKSESFKLFQSNKQYRVEVKMLKKKIQGFQDEMETMEGVMHKISKKAVKKNLSQKKERYSNRKLDNAGEDSPFKVNNSHFVKNSHQPTDRISLGTYHKAEEEPEADRSFINIRLTNIERDPTFKPFFQQGQPAQKNTQQIRLSLPSLNSQIPSIPPARIQLVQSYDINSSYHSKAKSIKKQEKGVQTTEPSLPPFNQPSSKNLVPNPGALPVFVKKSKRCITQRQIEVETKQQREMRMREWLKQSSHYRVMNTSKKQSKSIMYMSSVLGKNKLQSPGQGFSNAGKMLTTNYS